MMSLLMTGGFCCTPILGALSDMYGRKLQIMLPPLCGLLQRFVLIYTQVPIWPALPSAAPRALAGDRTGRDYQQADFTSLVSAC
jgi:hypothetical protein